MNGNVKGLKIYLIGATTNKQTNKTKKVPVVLAELLSGENDIHLQSGLRDPQG